MADNQELLLKIKAIDELTPVMARAVAAMEKQTDALVSSMEKLSPVTQEAEKNTERLNTKMVNLASAMSVAKTIYDGVKVAWDKISATVGEAIKEAEEAVYAENKLTGALVAQGLYIEKNVKSLEKYADELEKTKGVSGEQTKILLAQSIQMGLNIQQAEKMEEASRKLAATQRMDATSAFQLLSAALNGQTKGLAKIIPEVKNLTEAQLKSGAAADLVNKYLTAQYQLYEKSFSSAVDKAKNSVSNIYKALGKIITQNPLVIKGVEAFGNMAASLASHLDRLAKWLQANEDLIVQFGNAVGKTLTVGAAALTLWAVAAAAAAIPTITLAGAMSVLMSPITAVIAAGIVLTGVFMKWPGLFDQIIGGFKMFVGFFIEGIGKILDVASKFVSVFDKDMGASLERARDSVNKYAGELQLAGTNQVDLGTKMNETNKVVVKSVEEFEKENAVLDKNMKKTSDDAAAKKLLADSYAGVILGTKAMQDAMQGEVQERDKDLKRFNDYLEAKKRLAITKQEEQQMQLAQVRAKEVGQGGGEESIKARLDAELALERKHQAELGASRKSGAILQAQYDEEMSESSDKIRTLNLQREQAHQQALADIYATSPAGFEAQQAIKKQQFDLKLQQDAENLERAGQSEAQIAEFQRLQKAQFNQQLFEQQSAHDQQMIQLATQTQQQKLAALGDTPEAMEQKLALEEQQFQMQLQTKILRAQQAGATDTEINAIRAQAEMDHANQKDQIQIDYYNREAERQSKAHNDWESFQAQRQAAVIKDGAIMGNLRAIQNSQYYKAEQQMLTDLSSLRSSKSKSMFEVGKAAAIAQATINTFMSATSAFAALVGIPIIGPVLAAAAAAAAIASGMQNISQIKSQSFGGGQADEGMDSIPQALDGKSFVLSGGERVVQPSANKDLKEFLDREKIQNQQGGARGGVNYSVTLNYNGNGSKEDARKMAELVVQEIRSMSERGTPIMSSKGIVS